MLYTADDHMGGASPAPRVNRPKTPSAAALSATADGAGACVALAGLLTGPLSGWTIEHHATLDSTNTEAHRRIAAGVVTKTAILADRQTAGQGRHSRIWESSANNGLWVSLILPVTLPLDMLAQSALVLAVAVRQAVEQSTGVHLQTKWPNDLLYYDAATAKSRKCCGLLVECPEARSGATPLVLGIGLNINQIGDDFSAPLREIATSLRILSGRGHCWTHILRDILYNVDSWFGQWAGAGFAPVRAAWLAANCTMGKRLVLPDGYGYPHGTAHDLAPDGALLVLTDDGVVLRIDSGEIVFNNAQSFPS